MGVGEALRRLCDEIGWSYAVFWKAIGAADPVHLVWEDGYCGHASCPAGFEASEALGADVGREAGDAMCWLVKKAMASQVHVVGEGTVGRAAFTGNHQWIVHAAANDQGLASEVVAEMNHQFRAGIQTIAIIPVLPRGVLQLGSTNVVMENTNFVLQSKKLCSQLNNRSSMVVSASIKNDSSKHVQAHSVHDVPGIRSADTCSKVFSGFPLAYEQCSHPDVATVSSSTSANAGRSSLLKIAQQNGRAVREHILYSNPDVSFRQQAPYCDSRLGSNAESAVMASGFMPSSLAAGEKQPLLMTNIGQLELGNRAASSADLPRNVLLKSLSCRNPVVHENTNMTLLHGRDEVSDYLNGYGNFDFLPTGARVVRADLYNSAASQVLEQRCHSTSEMSMQKPLIPYKLSQSAKFTLKMESSERESFQAPADPSSEPDIQVSSGLNTGISQQNQLSSSNHICEDQKANEVTDSNAAVSMQGMKSMDGCKLPGISSQRTSFFPMEPTIENDLFDALGPEFHQLCHNVDADLTSWNAAKSQSSSRDAPEFSNYFGASAVIGSLDDEFAHSGFFSLADTDQLLDAVISNANPGGKQNSDDSASCKTSLTDIPSTSFLVSKELKQCDSSGVPPVLVKNELAVSNFVKQPCFFDKAEDGCLSQNNGMHKSQIRLWIENGQNMKCESASASNSKGLDTPNKANRKRSRPGENPRPRPKDRQLIQDRIKELREIVPNGAKCSIDVLLEKTIKHMLFMQSVTKHADKLKDSAKSKILGAGGENGPLWKDYFEGGATWAFEVGSQSMSCPIIVEDLDRPRQMLVEMLCEDRGIFLEIADFIRGLGLTILRGVMEARKSKIWARFTVEANRDVTRMEIFLSLMRLLEPSCESSGAAENANNVNMPLGMVHQPIIPATGRPL